MCKVAEAIFDDGAIRFYINGEGFTKVSNPAPCAIWMMKPGFETEKSLFHADATESLTLKFPDACLVWLIGLRKTQTCLMTDVDPDVLYMSLSR